MAEDESMDWLLPLPEKFGLASHARPIRDMEALGLRREPITTSVDADGVTS